MRLIFYHFRTTASYSSNVANFYLPHLRLAPPLGGDPVSVFGIMLPWPHPSSQPKRHLDRFSHFCTAHDCDRQTDRPRHTRSVTMGRIYDATYEAMPPINMQHCMVVLDVAYSGAL